MNISPYPIIILVQARMTSTRLPGKVLKPLMGKPMLAHVLDRLKRTKASDIVVALTTNPKDLPLLNFCIQYGVKTFQGSEQNVLERFAQAAQFYKAHTIVRICSDCPLIDPDIVNLAIETYLENYQTYDYVSNTQIRTFPRGLDVEVFSWQSLEKAFAEAKDSAEKEHVTPYIYRHPHQFRLKDITAAEHHANLRLTVDTQEDFDLIEKIYQELYPQNPQFSSLDVIQLLKKHPQWLEINAHIHQKTI